MCIEREKDFKSREVNCLKECALALILQSCFLTRLFNINSHLVSKSFEFDAKVIY